MIQLSKFIAFNTIIPILSLFLFEVFIQLIFTEIQFHATDSELLADSVYSSSPGLKPNSEGSSSGIKKYVDENRFWKYSKKTTKRTKKILLLGDSVTMGIGIESDSTFAGRLDNDFMEVKNCALIGYSIEDYYNVCLTLLEHKSITEFDKVIMFWCLNDIYSNYPNNSAPAQRGFGEIMVGFLRNNSKTYHLLKNEFTDRKKVYFDYDKQFYNSNDSLFINSISTIKKVDSLLTERNIPLEVYIMPYEYQLRVEQNDSIYFPQNLMIEELKSSNIHLVDMKMAFENKEYASSDYFLFGDGIHFSNLGHKVIADYLKTIFSNGK